MVCRNLARAVGRTAEPLGGGAAMRRPGSLDRIGLDLRPQYGRLSLIANNSRFLILPGWNQPNIGSRVLSLTERRAAGDWPTRFGHPLLLLETFVDPQRFHGGGYRAANWMELGRTQGRLQRASRRPQAGLRAPLMPRCTRTNDPRRSRSFTTDRSLQDHAQCRTDAPTLAVLQEDSRSAPQPGGRPPCAACAGTKPSSIGPTPWDSKPANVLTADGRMDAMSFPANM